MYIIIFFNIRKRNNMYKNCKPAIVAKQTDTQYTILKQYKVLFQ